MYTDELYKRSMGMRYDPERARLEAANGTAGYTGEPDRGNGFELDASDLYVQTSETSANASRLQEIELELALLFDIRELTTEEIERQLLLEAEKVVRLENEVDELLAADPARAQKLKDLFMSQLIERAEAGEPVDAEMFVESDELASVITEQHPGLDADGLVRVAETMQALIRAQLVLERHIDSNDELAFAA